MAQSYFGSYAVWLNGKEANCTKFPCSFPATNLIYLFFFFKELTLYFRPGDLCTMRNMQSNQDSEKDSADCNLKKKQNKKINKK